MSDENEAICAVCGKSVAADDQNDHLQSQHLGPHYFRFNLRPYRTMQPSMRCGDLLKLVDGDAAFHVYEERNNAKIFYGHSDTINLTQKPQLFAYKTATGSCPTDE